MIQFLNEALSFIKVLLITIVRPLGHEAAWLSNISETIKTQRCDNGNVSKSIRTRKHMPGDIFIRPVGLSRYDQSWLAHLTSLIHLLRLTKSNIHSI